MNMTGGRKVKKERRTRRGSLRTQEFLKEFETFYF